MDSGRRKRQRKGNRPPPRHEHSLPLRTPTAGFTAFGLNFYILSATGDHAGVSMYPSRYALCTDNGPETLDTTALFDNPPRP